MQREINDDIQLNQGVIDEGCIWFDFLKFLFGRLAFEKSKSP